MVRSSSDLWGYGKGYFFVIAYSPWHLCTHKAHVKQQVSLQMNNLLRYNEPNRLCLIRNNENVGIFIAQNGFDNLTVWDMVNERKRYCKHIAHLATYKVDSKSNCHSSVFFFNQNITWLMRHHERFEVYLKQDIKIESQRIELMT